MEENLKYFLVSISLFLCPVIVDGRRCVACTHDGSNSNSKNPDCIGDLGNVTLSQDMIVECDPAYGDEACFTMVTCDNACYESTADDKTELLNWNRGCCSPGPGNQNCPTDEPNHIDNSWYERWRSRCTDEDICNTDSPVISGSGGSGGDGDGIIVVPGKSGAQYIKEGSIALVLLLCASTVLV